MASVTEVEFSLSSASELLAPPSSIVMAAPSSVLSETDESVFVLRWKILWPPDGRAVGVSATEPLRRLQVKYEPPASRTKPPTAPLTGSATSAIVSLIVSSDAEGTLPLDVVDVNDAAIDDATDPMIEAVVDDVRGAVITVVADVAVDEDVSAGDVSAGEPAVDSDEEAAVGCVDPPLDSPNLGEAISGPGTPSSPRRRPEFLFASMSSTQSSLTQARSRLRTSSGAFPIKTS